MEVPSLTSVQPSQAQTNATTSVAGTATETSTVLNTPDNVVSPSAESDGTRGDRGKDTLGQQQEQVATAQVDLNNAQSSNRRTQLGFNSELNRVFLEVVDTKTDEIVETIPAEELVRFFSGLVESGETPEVADQNGGVIDQSV